MNHRRPTRLVLALLVSSLVLGSCRTADERSEARAAAPDWEALRAQYPEIFEVAASFECGQRLSNLFARIDEVGGVEARTANTVGSELLLLQGPIEFIVGGQYYNIRGPHLHEGKLADRTRVLCPLRVVGPEYVGGTVFVDEQALATVTSPKTSLTVPEHSTELRVVKDGLPDIIQPLRFNRLLIRSEDLDVFLQVGTVDVVFLSLGVRSDYWPGDVYLDGARIGNMHEIERILEVEPGEHHLRLVREPLPDVEKTVIVTGGRAIEFVDLWPSPPPADPLPPPP